MALALKSQNGALPTTPSQSREENDRFALPRRVGDEDA
jgi:hypothetical protein